MLRWMLLGSRVGLGIVMCPLWRSAFGFACLFLFSHVFTGHPALGRLGRHCLARQFSWPKRYASCRGAYSLHGHLYGHICHSSCFTRVAHMCHDMTGPAIMAGRLGASVPSKASSRQDSCSPSICQARFISVDKRQAHA